VRRFGVDAARLSTRTKLSGERHKPVAFIDILHIIYGARDYGAMLF
jgi:hypothetical protein